MKYIIRFYGYIVTNVYALIHNRPCNTLRLSGPFSLAEMHTWLGFCLPEVPEKPPSSSDVANFSFVSSFLETILQVEYRYANRNIYKRFLYLVR